jgi:hypothetical protein
MTSSILLYGLVRDDGRAHSEVETFAHPGRRIERFHQWSEGMITLRGAFARNYERAGKVNRANKSDVRTGKSVNEEWEYWECL